MQAGLLKVVPQAVLDLLTWQELEKKVCGDPEVTVDALRKLSEFSVIGRKASKGRDLRTVRMRSKNEFLPWPLQLGLRTLNHLTRGCSTFGRL